MDEPRGVGRPAYQPTDGNRQMVRVLKANGIGERTIATELQIDRKTLRKHFRTELRDGFERVKAALSAVIVREGLAGNVAACKFWLAARCPEWRVIEGREVTVVPPREKAPTLVFEVPRWSRDPDGNVIEETD
jgi:hypothetical protein